MEETKEKIIKILKQNITGLIIALVAIIGSVTYVNLNECEVCEKQTYQTLNLLK